MKYLVHVYRQVSLIMSLPAVPCLTKKVLYMPAKCGMLNEKRKAENGKRKTENGKRKTKNEKEKKRKRENDRE